MIITNGAFVLTRGLRQPKGNLKAPHKKRRGAIDCLLEVWKIAEINNLLMAADVRRGDYAAGVCRHAPTAERCRRPSRACGTSSTTKPTARPAPRVRRRRPAWTWSCLAGRRPPRRRRAPGVWTSRPSRHRCRAGFRRRRGASGWRCGRSRSKRPGDGWSAHHPPHVCRISAA